MSLKTLFASLTLAAVAFTLTAADEKKPAAKKSASAGPLQPQMTPEGGWDKAMGTLGEKPAAPWTDTTIAAGVDKKPLSGKITTVTGEIVDLSCYLQLGKHGEAHIACAQKCATNGQPIGLLDGRRTLWLLFPEEHHPRRDGGAEIRTTLIPLMGKSVTLRGTATTLNGNRALYLRAADLAELKDAGAAASPKPMRAH